MPLMEKKGHYTLHQHTLYRLSLPPNANGNGADDSSTDWIVKVSETAPNVFSLLEPFSSNKLCYPPGAFPKCLNLLDYRISEVCKSYVLKGRNHESIKRTICIVLGVINIKKVIPLCNYVVDCDFAALALGQSGEVNYWKVGDEGWTHIDTKGGHEIHDVILFAGKCYAVDCAGVLVSFDSKMQLVVVASPAANFPTGRENVLFECKSDLYVVTKACHVRADYLECPNQPKYFVDVGLTIWKLNKSNGKWNCIGDLGDNAFLLGKDVSVGVSAKDCERFKGNTAYLYNCRLIDDVEGKVYGDMAGIYRMDNPRPVRHSTDEDAKKLNRRPPSWIMPSASSPEP